MAPSDLATADCSSLTVVVRSELSRPSSNAAGFTLVELLVALFLMALIASTLYGSLSLAADSWNRGEAKSEQIRQMRLTQEFLRVTLTGASPLRATGSDDSPFPFAGTDASVSFPAALPARAGGGLLYLRLTLVKQDDAAHLVLLRAVPNYGSATAEDFAKSESTTLADGIRSLRFHYFGAGYARAAEPAAPRWRDHWDDKLEWPTLIRVDVTPVHGDAWPPLVVELKLAAQTFCDEIARAHNMCAGN